MKTQATEQHRPLVKAEDLQALHEHMTSLIEGFALENRSLWISLYRLLDSLDDIARHTDWSTVPAAERSLLLTRIDRAKNVLKKIDLPEDSSTLTAALTDPAPPSGKALDETTRNEIRRLCGLLFGGDEIRAA